MFDFLGSTHMCAKDGHGRFKLQRVTSKKRMRAKLRAGQDRTAQPDASPHPEQNGSAGSREDTSPTSPCQTPPEGGLRDRSHAMPEMVRSISRQRLVERWGNISAANLSEITHCVHLLTRAG